jgi:hypothetical protein
VSVGQIFHQLVVLAIHYFFGAFNALSTTYANFLIAQIFGTLKFHRSTHIMFAAAGVH